MWNFGGNYLNEKFCRRNNNINKNRFIVIQAVHFDIYCQVVWGMEAFQAPTHSFHNIHKHFWQNSRHLPSEFYCMYWEEKERTFFVASNTTDLLFGIKRLFDSQSNWVMWAMENLDNSIDNKRIEKSLSLLTRKFVELLLASKNGILDLKSVSALRKYFSNYEFILLNLSCCAIAQFIRIHRIVRRNFHHFDSCCLVTVYETIWWENSLHSLQFCKIRNRAILCHFDISSITVTDYTCNLIIWLLVKNGNAKHWWYFIVAFFHVL